MLGYVVFYLVLVVIHFAALVGIFLIVNWFTEGRAINLITDYSEKNKREREAYLVFALWLAAFCFAVSPLSSALIVKGRVIPFGNLAFYGVVFATVGTITAYAIGAIHRILANRRSERFIPYTRLRYLGIFVVSVVWITFWATVSYSSSLLAFEAVKSLLS